MTHASVGLSPLKVLRAATAHHPDALQRFEREARIVSNLNHPHICTLHDIGRHDGVAFLVMEFLDGETLAQRLAKGPLPIEETIGTINGLFVG